MPIDSNLFATFGQRPRSYADSVNALQTIEANDVANQANQLKLGQMRQAVADDAALRETAQGFGADDVANYNALLSRGLVPQAQAYQKSVLERQKSQADISKTKADTRKTELANYQSQVEAGMKVLQAATTPQLAIQLVTQGIQSGTFTLDQAKEYLSDMPQDPAGFAQWREANLMQGMEVGKRIELGLREQAQAETARHNAANEKNAAGQLSVAQGNLATRRAELEHSKNAPRGQFLETPTGYVLGDPRTGSVAPVIDPATGKPLQGKSADRALTDSQAKANLFGSRMQEADRVLTELEGKYSPAAVNAKMGAENIPVVGGVAGFAGNLMLSEAGQKSEQAQRDFVNAVLRRESGAVISQQEFANAQKQYFPQPGDTKAVLDQKRRNRTIAIEGLMAEVPSGKRGVPSLNSPTGKSGATGTWGDVPSDIADILNKHGGK